MTGHAGDGVIGNDNRADGAIVCHVEKSGEAAVAEGGVAENCNGFLCLLMTACLFHAVCHSDGCTHTYACVNSAERRQRTESVAADIGTYREFELSEYVIKTPVRAAGAEYGGTHGNALSVHGTCFLFAVKLVCNLARKKLTLNAGAIFAAALDAPRLDGVLIEGLHILNYIESVNACCELFDEFAGHGVCKTELQHGRCGHCFFYVVICRTACDDADFPVRPFDTVDGKSVRIFGKFLFALFNIEMTGDHVCGH